MMLPWKGICFVEKHQVALLKYGESQQIQIAILKALTDNLKSVK